MNAIGPWQLTSVAHDPTRDVGGNLLPLARGDKTTGCGRDPKSVDPAASRSLKGTLIVPGETCPKKWCALRDPCKRYEPCTKSLGDVFGWHLMPVLGMSYKGHPVKCGAVSTATSERWRVHSGRHCHGLPSRTRHCDGSGGTGHAAAREAGCEWLHVDSDDHLRSLLLRLVRLQPDNC
jgi:hypothetical protein